jgi:hypothetical protein
MASHREGDGDGVSADLRRHMSSLIHGSANLHSNCNRSSMSPLSWDKVTGSNHEISGIPRNFSVMEVGQVAPLD